MTISVLASTSFLLFSVTTVLVYNSLPTESGMRVNSSDHHDISDVIPTPNIPIRAQLGQVVAVLK